MHHPILKLLTALVVFTSCSTKNEANTSDTDSDKESVTVSVTAAAGGVLILSDGAQAAFGPGALAADGEVTLSRISCGGFVQGEGFGSCLYEITSTVPLAGRYNVSLPADPDRGDPDCLLAMTEEGFRCLGDSVILETPTAGTASVFTSFILGASSTKLSMPSNALTDLEADLCRSGDLLGTWQLLYALGTVTDVTGESWSGGPDFEGTCEEGDHYLTHTFTHNERLTFTDVPSDDGGFGFEFSIYDSIYEYSVTTDECLERLDLSCTQDVCVDEGGICSCYFMSSEGASSGGIFYYLDGEGRWLTGPGGEVKDYCVSDNLLVVYEHGMGSGMVLKLYERTE